jgi:sugar phosphate isomerase/epimerase
MQGMPCHAAAMNTPTHLARRDFLRLAAFAPLAAVTSARALAPIARVGGASFRPGLNAYSFKEMLEDNLKHPDKGIDLFGICDFCAKHDIEAVDLTGYFFPGYPNAPEDSYISRIKRHTHDLGLSISGTGVTNDFAVADEAVRAEGVKVTKTWIEVAARLGAPVVRVFAGPRSSKLTWQQAAKGAQREEVETWMAAALRECAEHGEKFGVIVAIQNHGDFLSTGAEHLSLLQRTNHPWCGPLVDTGKYFSENPYADIALMAPHAVNWQIKETLGSSLKSPRTDFKKLARIIHDSGYRGFAPIETLNMGRADYYDPAAEVVKVLAAMREAIAELK